MDIGGLFGILGENLDQIVMSGGVASRQLSTIIFHPTILGVRYRLGEVFELINQH